MKYILLSLFLSIFISSVCAQFPNVPIDHLRSNERPCEPSIAISPKDTNVVVAGAIYHKVYVSLDGGRNWKTSNLTSQYGVFGDPNILAAEDGHFYYFHLANPDGKRNGPGFLEWIVCQASADSGKTWSDGSGIGYNPPKMQDKEWSVEDPTTGRVYISWTQFDKYDSHDPKDRSNIMITWSDDKGENWAEPTMINRKSGDCLDDDKTTEGAVPAVGPNGEVYVAWANKSKLYFDRSFDKGKTWLKKDKKIAKQPGGWAQDVPGVYRCNGMPITVCDLSDGPHRGAIYVCWSDNRNGSDDSDIWLSTSLDKGDNWSKPVRVNNDGAGNMQFLPWLTIDQSTGYLYCVYYDRRNSTGLETEVYVSYSIDGGKSFHDVKVSETSFTPASRFFLGDYNDISAVQGKIMPVWTRMNSKGRTTVWTSLITHKALEAATTLPK